MSAERKEGGGMRALFLGALVVGSVVIFALGVMVGSNVRIPAEALRTPATGTAPSPAAAGAIRAETPLREEIAFPKKGVEIKGEDMSFYKTLAETKRPEPATVATATQPVPAPASTIPIAVTPAGPSPAAAPSAPIAPSKTPAPAATPSAVEATAKPTAAPSATARVTTYAVQVMLTNDEAEGQAAADSLAKAGYGAYLVIRKGAKYHTAVRVGKLATEAEARKLLADINKKTKYKGAFIVKE